MTKCKYCSRTLDPEWESGNVCLRCEDMLWDARMDLAAEKEEREREYEEVEDE